MRRKVARSHAEPGRGERWRRGDAVERGVKEKGNVWGGAARGKLREREGGGPKRGYRMEEEGDSRWIGGGVQTGGQGVNK